MGNWNYLVPSKKQIENSDIEGFLKDCIKEFDKDRVKNVFIVSLGENVGILYSSLCSKNYLEE